MAATGLPPLTQAAFDAAYADFCKLKGLPFQLSVVCQGAPVSLYNAFAVIQAGGGCDAVADGRGWAAAADAVLAPRSSKGGMSLHVRHMYETYLQEFEKKAGDALMRGYSIPAATHAVLEAATRANTTARANSTNSNGSGGNDEQGTKRVRDSNSPEEREDSPAARPPLGGGRGGGGRGRGRGGGRPKLKPQPAAAPLPPGYKPMLAPNHQLSSRAILPPHGRGRAPKVLPPTLMRRATPAPALGAASPAAAAAAAPAPKSAKRDPRAAGRTLRGAGAASTAKASPAAAWQLAPSTMAAQLMASGFDSPAPGSDSEAGACGSLTTAHATARAPQRRTRKKKARGDADAAVDGVKLVAPFSGDGRMPAAPAAARSSRARWQMQGYSSTEQNYGQEPLAAMVSWLRDAARKLGHSSPWEPPLLASQETHAYEQCLTRWRKSEFENLEPPPAPVAEAGKRRSSRHRAGTQFFTPTFGGPAKHAREFGPTAAGAKKRDYLEDESSDEEKETREGSGFQAELPPQRPMPSGGRAGGPPPDEARWLTGRVLGPGQLAARRQAPPAGPDFATLPIEERLVIEGKAVAALRAAVGPHAGPLGLDLMGGVYGRDWTDHEAKMLEEGMRLVGRDFGRIQKSLLQTRREAELILYYYNVWKTRATPRARSWFTALEQARKAEEAEEAAERAKAAEAEARRVAAQMQSVQTRQLRDAVAWLRNSAKWPKDSLPRQKHRERAIRMKSLLAAENVGGIAGEGAEMPTSPYSDRG